MNVDNYDDDVGDDDEGDPATEGAIRERATTAPENSVMLMLASAISSSNCMSIKHWGTGKEAQRNRRVAIEQMKPRWTKLASTWIM